MSKAKHNSLRGNLTPAEVRAAIHKICSDNDYDPFKDLIEMAVETQMIEVGGKEIEVRTCSVDQRIAIAKEIAPYLAPKLKNIELQGAVDHEFTISVKKFGEVDDKLVVAKEAERNLLTTGLAESKKVIEAVVSDED